MEVTIIVGGISGAGILALVAERIWAIKKERKNGNSNDKILKALKELGDTTDTISKEVGLTQSDVKVIKNELSNINQRCATHLQTQSEINKAHAISISKNTDKLFELAQKKTKE